MKRYQVLTAAVILPIDGGDGPVIHTLYRGMSFEADPNNARVKYNAESGYIAEIGAAAVAGVDNSGTPLVDDKPTVGDGQPGDPVALNDPGVVNEAAQRAATERTAAAAKLPADGSAPDGRASVEVWREYAVAKGYDRTAVEGSSRDEIKALFKS